MVSRILVTGASGYVAMHVVDLLLKQGHRVRGTVRNVNDASKTEHIRKLGPVELVQTDLLDAESWKGACKDVDIVMHIASPLPLDQPDDESLVIKPAVEGTLNVLRASLEADVKRVVLTSSGLTVAGHHYENRTYTENDWIDVSKAKSAYQKSKILAERAAWDFVNERAKNKEKCFEFAVVIPVLVFGPILSPSLSASVTRFSRTLIKHTETIENRYISMCDVRDVALAHVRAGFLREAVGHRHIITSWPRVLSTKDYADILKEAGYKVANVNDSVDKSTIDKAGMDQTRMIQVLGIRPTEFRKTILDMTQSLKQYGIIDQ